MTVLLERCSVSDENDDKMNDESQIFEEVNTKW